MSEEEPVSKLEGLELSSNDAAEGGAHIGSRQYVLGQSPSEKINVAGRIVEGGELLPQIVWNVTRALVPGAGPLEATFLQY